MKSKPRAIRTARRLAGAAARQEGASDDAVGAIEIAMGEALNNVWRHAYGGGVGQIGVEIGFDEVTGNMTVSIHDSGRPVTPPLVPTSLPAAGEGGRGLYVISQLSDAMEIKHPDRRGRGTAVRFVKHLR